MKAKNLKEFHRIVCERDNYTCHVCKKCFNYDAYFDINGVNQYVCGHHVKTQGAHPEERFETDNGRCTCAECHNKIH